MSYFLDLCCFFLSGRYKFGLVTFAYHIRDYAYMWHQTRLQIQIYIASLVLRENCAGNNNI